MKGRTLEAAWFPVAECVELLVGVQQKLAELAELAVATICDMLIDHRV